MYSWITELDRRIEVGRVALSMRLVNPDGIGCLVGTG